MTPPLFLFFFCPSQLYKYLRIKMRGFMKSQHHGECSICRENGILGFVDCGGFHWCCVNCFIKLDKQNRCSFCNCDVTKFCYYIKVEHHLLDPTCVIPAHDTPATSHNTYEIYAPPIYHYGAIYDYGNGMTEADV
jgi:hypothetical protein